MRIFLIFLLLTYISIGIAQNKEPEKSDEWLTFAEKTNFQETPNLEETKIYCQRLEQASNHIKLFSFGKTPEDRDLFYLIVSKDNSFTPEDQKKSSKALVMVQCGIHAGEIDGKDAMLMLMREIAITKKLDYLLDNVNLLIIPVFNADGHERISPYNRINQNGPKEMGWRVNANNLNLNRDYMKADALEMKYWLRLFNKWLPDFFIDCHVTDGADFPYTVNYEIETHENMSAGIANWTKSRFLPNVITNIEKEGHLIAPYCYFRNEYDVTKGITGGVMAPRLSTGYTAIQNRQGFLIETHSYKDYKTRVDATYKLVRIILEFINKDSKLLKDLNQKADKESENLFVSKSQFPLVFDNVPVPNGTFHFKSYKTIKEMSKVSGTFKRSYVHEIQENDIPFYDSMAVSKSVIPPFAYLIPKAWKNIIDVLQIHGIKVGQLLEDKTLPVEIYKLTNPKWKDTPYEGRHPVTYNIETAKDTLTYQKGTYIVPTNQRMSKVILYLLEPASKESLISWGFMDAIFEQKEYGEDYVLEKLAERMLKADNNLKLEFENKLKSDTSFAKNSYERLNFFYERSPFWDNAIGFYPVTRLMERQNFNR